MHEPFSQPEPVVKSADKPKSIHLRTTPARRCRQLVLRVELSGHRKLSGAPCLQFFPNPVLSREADLMAPQAPQRSRHIASPMIAHRFHRGEALHSFSDCGRLLVARQRSSPELNVRSSAVSSCWRLPSTRFCLSSSSSRSFCPVPLPTAPPGCAARVVPGGNAGILEELRRRGS
jgi:hypothetical protein